MKSKHKYSFVEEAGDHFLIHHPDDGKFKVAKKDIKKSLMKKISGLPKFMAEGGEVDDDTEDSQPSQDSPAPTNPFFSLDKLKEAGNNLGNKFINFNNENVYGVRPPEQKNPDIKDVSYEPIFKDEKNKVLPGPDEKQPETPAPQAQPTPVVPDYMGKLGQDYKQVEGGINQAAQSESKAQKQIADSIAEQNIIQQEQYQSMMESRKQLQAETDKLVGDIQNQKIDSRSVWNNMSTGGKIAASIGILLSGFGQGLVGGQNSALKILDDAQNRDLEAQKAELGKKQNLLSVNLRKYGDLDTAYNMTRIQQNAAMTAELQKIQASSNSEIVKANAQKAIGTLNMQRDQQMQQMGMAQTMRGVATGAVPVSTNQIGMLPEDLQKKAVALPHTQRVFFANTPEDANKAKEATQAATELKASIDEAKQFQQRAGGARTVGIPFIWDSAAEKEAQRIQNKLQISWAKLNGVGRETTPEQKEKLYKDVPPIGSFRQGNVSNSLNELETSSNQKLDSYYSEYLPTYKGTKIKNFETAPRVK